MRLQSHPYGPLLAALQASGRADGRLGWPRSPLRAALSGQAGRLAVPGGETQAIVTGITTAGLPQKSLQSSESAGRLQEI
jgi:hypothetical protein